MDESIVLLDTPKQASLHLRSSTLRAALKAFEHTFATDHDGRKPTKDDIKAHPDVAGKYKEYNKIRHVLAGKLSLAVLQASSPSKRNRPHSRSEGAVIASPTKQRLQSTPRTKRLRPDDIDPYDAPSSVTPRRALSAIGPTPQRDGQALGIFDLMSNPGSGRSAQTTSVSRKRTIDAFLGDQGDLENQPLVAQTPSQRHSKKGSDILDHLTGTPASYSQASRNKHSRTPVSDGKKFLLSHFFATPSAVRYASVAEPLAEPTPLRNRVLGLSPSKADSTPVYLRRSYSFKDRLLSASSNPSRDNSSDIDPSSPSSVRVGPRKASGRQVRFMPKPLSQIAAEMRKKEDELHDDDLDAMRDMENEEAGMLVADSHPPTADLAANQAEQAPQRVWKKRGQKRTTKRVIMRPSKLMPSDKQKSVSRKAKEDEEDIDNDLQLEISEDDYDNFVDDGSQDELSRDIKHSISSKASQKKSTKISKEHKPLGKLPKETTINPNAVSHMNFRSLKIKNKNSKAKGRGRGRFGRR